MCGYPVTPELIQRLNAFKVNFDLPDKLFSYTFVTDVGTFNTVNNVVNFSVTNEFLILRLSQTDASYEDLYVRLCLVKSFTESRNDE
jgi:hypothetical protein